MDREQQPAQQPLPFKESLILNLERNKDIIIHNQAVFDKNINLIDELIELIRENPDVAEFAEKMQELQTSAQQAR